MTLTKQPPSPSTPAIGVCRLCGLIRPLVNSHVIPDFNFKPLKEKEGRFYVLSPDPEKKERKLQRGFTERLLCAECDNVRLGRNETYFAKALERGPWPRTTVTNRLIIFRDHDYKRTKNCLLSILWRMSISSLELFKDVSLGPKHEEVLRLGLLNDREFAEDEYPISVTAPLIDGKHYADLILQPDSTRIDGNRVYRCVISGLIYTYYVGSGRLDQDLKLLTLRHAEFPIVKAEVREIPFLAQAFRELGSANAIRDLNRTVR